MNKTDLRVVKTLARIDDALIGELKEKPLQEVTVESICNRAQINRTTFYKHYKDRFALVDDYVDRFLEGFSEKGKVIFKDLTDNGLAESEESVDAIKETTEFILTRKEEFKLFWDRNLSRNVFNEMITTLADAYKEVRLEQEPSIAEDKMKMDKLDLFSRLTSAAYMQTIRWWINNDVKMDKDEFNDMFRDLIFNGLTGLYV